MKYLCIQNSGEADVKDMTLLGLSTSREDEKCIGQFGTGFIQGVLACLRNGIQPVVYVGKDRVTFRVEGEKDEVVFVYRRKTYRLNVCLGFGELDWTSPTMGIREFISNALDADGLWCADTVHVATRMEGVAGATRVFLPYSPFREYHKNLGQYFLHSRRLEHCDLIAKDEPSPCRIYRKGVFVRELKQQSLFDYNLGESAKIDECRNMSDYMALFEALALLRKCSSSTLIETVFTAVLTNTQVLEVNEVEYASWKRWDDQWKNTWWQLHKDKQVCPSSLIRFVKGKVPDAVPIVSQAWFDSLTKHMGATDATRHMLDVEKRGKSIIPATPVARKTVQRVWQKLEKLAFTNGKEMPQVACFHHLMDEDGSDTHGMYSDGVVYLREDHEGNAYVALHELIHHVTGAEDETYAFSEACLRLAHTLMKGVNNES